MIQTQMIPFFLSLHSLLIVRFLSEGGKGVGPHTENYHLTHYLMGPHIHFPPIVAISCGGSPGAAGGATGSHWLLLHWDTNVAVDGGDKDQCRVRLRHKN